MKTKSIISAMLAAGISMSALAQNDAVLMTINGKDITKEEFEYIYHKNNKQQADSKSIDDYMPLFINYKLKVDAAEKAGIDTTASFIKELEGYRQELSKPYLTDRATEERLLKEAYDNYCKNVEISHILVSVNPQGGEADKAKALARAQALAARARAGEDFATLAKENTDDIGSKERGGYLGYIRGGRLIYPFEKVAFAMNAGEISEPVETRFGYHIIKVHDVRKDRGERLCAHIFLVVPNDAPAEVEEQKRAAAEAIYNELMAGANFAEMAKRRSEDPSNAQRGGELPWCSSGDFVKEFEEVAFSLKLGEFSKPVRSNYGYHIIKLLNRRPVLSFEKKRDDLVQRLKRDERALMAHNVLMERLKKEHNYTVNQEAIKGVSDFCGKTIDDFALSIMPKMSYVMATYADCQITAKELASSLSKMRLAPNHNPEVVIQNEVNRIAERGLMELESQSLKTKYPEFNNLLNEYRDGILLFEISNREVWEKAATDVEGLDKYFKQNRKNYTWDRPRYKGFVVACANDEVAEQVKVLINKTKENDVVAAVEAQFNNDSITQVSIERGLYVEGDNAMVDELAFNGTKAKRNKELPVVFVEGRVLNAPETYLDVRGQVTADYQGYLEKEWVKELNRKAKVVKNEDVLKTIK